MAFVENQGARIHWDEQGHGAPVLLIMGLGYTSDMWYRIRPVLAAHYRTIALDNRGVGRSDLPPGPYPITLMASAFGAQTANEVPSGSVERCAPNLSKRWLWVPSLNRCKSNGLSKERAITTV